MKLGQGRELSITILEKENLHVSTSMVNSQYLTVEGQG